MTFSMNRRRFFHGAAVAVTASAAGQAVARDSSSPVDESLAIPDEGWSLCLDREAQWQSDTIYLPANVPPITSLPSHAPSDGWEALYKAKARSVTLPATVEQFEWGQTGTRPYSAFEYRYAKDDAVPQNGAYVGVSWWSRTIDIPASAKGKQVWLHLRGARLRAEIFLNEKLVGYSILAELPIDCDLTGAMVPGGANRLAIRITNPGGIYDWRDSGDLTWGAVKFYPGHGFGGLDRGLTLSIHPLAGRIVDAWVLNTPEPRTVLANVELHLKDRLDLDGLKTQLGVALTDANGGPVAADVTLEDLKSSGGTVTARFKIHASEASLWDLDTPNLYHLVATWRAGEGEVSRRTVRFGFRWYSLEGLGKNALLRLNGRRIKLYTAISWGFWGYNGLWPTPELARREVEAAKALGLNSLSFHRNLGRAEVLDRQDEMGLTRTMEPGNGREAIGRLLKPDQVRPVPDAFARDYLTARVEGMVKAFRSHPSLLQYTLQNEIGADLQNPDVERILRIVHAADPSRTVILNDGFVARGAAQAMLTPYDDHLYRSDVEPAGGWWVQHQSAGDQWYDKFYVDKDNFVHRQTMPQAIVEFGEMEGCAVADNHVKMIADILQHGGTSYDLQDHKDIVAGYNTFLDKWNFREAFPTTEELFLSIGAKQYLSWQEYLENIRICDQVDMAAISGWETTAIENHSGIVDNLRYFHNDRPDLLRLSLLPVRPVAKQRALTYATGEAAVLDIWLLNDTGSSVSGELKLSLTGPDGLTVEIGTYTAPVHVVDQNSYLLAEAVRSPALERPGKHTVCLALSGLPDVTFERDYWVVDTHLQPWKTSPRIGLAGVAHSLRNQLAGLEGVILEDFVPGRAYDAVIAQGLKADEIAKRQIGDVTGNEAAPKGVKPVIIEGEMSPEVLDAVAKGVPLLALVPEDGLADGVATQLSKLGLFSYGGQIGDLRAPWMGNWNILRKHAVFDGIPADMAANTWHQIPGQASNGLLVDGEGLEIIAAYSRDHDRRLGASSFTVKKGKAKVLFHRMPAMAEALQKRFMINAVAWLVS